jgi:hypothetical protein
MVGMSGRTVLRARHRFHCQRRIAAAAQLATVAAVAATWPAGRRGRRGRNSRLRQGRRVAPGPVPSLERWHWLAATQLTSRHACPRLGGSSIRQRAGRPRGRCLPVRERGYPSRSAASSCQRGPSTARQPRWAGWPGLRLVDHLAAQLHPTANGDLHRDAVALHSRRVVRWRCPRCGPPNCIEGDDP